MFRPVLSLLLAPLTTAAVLTFVAAPAQAAGVCNIASPTRIAIGRPYIGLQVKESGDCAAVGGYGSWDLVHPSQGLQDVAIFDSTTFKTTTDTWDVYAYSTKIGNQTWTPSAAWDPDDISLMQNRVTVTVKLAAGAWISSSRKGAVVILKGTSLLYSVSNDNYFKRSAGGVFQFRERGTTTWKNLKAVTTNSAGVATMAYTYSPVRDYRFSLYSTAISWDLGSAVTTR